MGPGEEEALEAMVEEQCLAQLESSPLLQDQPPQSDIIVEEQIENVQSAPALHSKPATKPTKRV